MSNYNTRLTGFADACRRDYYSKKSERPARQGMHSVGSSEIPHYVPYSTLSKHKNCLNEGTDFELIYRLVFIDLLIHMEKAAKAVRSRLVDSDYEEEQFKLAKVQKEKAEKYKKQNNLVERLFAKF